MIFSKIALFIEKCSIYSESISICILYSGSVEIFLHFSTEFYYFTELKTYDLSYSIYKHDAIDTADPSSIQDAWIVIWTS